MKKRKAENPRSQSCNETVYDGNDI